MYREKKAAYKTIDTSVGTMRFLLRKMGIQLNPKQCRDLREEIIGASNSRAGRGQAPTISKEDVERAIANEQAKGTVSGIRNAAIIAVSFSLFNRSNELREFDVSDFRVNKETGTGTLFIHRSKTDQQAKGTNLAISINVTTRLNTYLSEAGHKTGALAAS